MNCENGWLLGDFSFLVDVCTGVCDDKVSNLRVSLTSEQALANLQTPPSGLRDNRLQSVHLTISKAVLRNDLLHCASLASTSTVWSGWMRMKAWRRA